MTSLRVAIVTAVAVVVAWPATAARADVLVWSADAPFATGNTITVDFGATLSGVTGLEAVVAGIGGVQHWTIYQGVDNPTGTVPFEMFLACNPDLAAGNAADARVWLPELEPFSYVLALAPAGDWSFLQDGMLTLGVDYVHGAFPINPFCFGTGYTLPVIEHLDLIVTCDAALPAKATSWGAVKATFR